MVMKVTLKIDNNLINQNTCVKYVGIIIDDSLKWLSQIHKIRNVLKTC